MTSFSSNATVRTVRWTNRKKKKKKDKTSWTSQEGLVHAVYDQSIRNRVLVWYINPLSFPRTTTLLLIHA